MKKIRKAVRFFVLVIFIILACAGVGMFNHFPVQRDRYENEIRTEQVERKKHDDEEMTVDEVS